MAFKTFTPGEILLADDVMTYLMRQSVIVCTSSTRPASPVQGMTIVETDTGNQRRYWNGSWVIWPPQFVEVSDSTNITTTSTTFVPGSPQVSTTFTGPPSGRVLVFISAHIEGNDPERALNISFEIRETNVSGSLIYPLDSNDGLRMQGINNLQATAVRQITGLTVGQLYFIRTLHSVTAGTGSIFHRRIGVQPLAN